MAKLKDIIGEEVFKHLPEEKQKEYENRDYEDISSGAYIPKKRFDKVNEDAKAYKIQMIEKEKEISDLKDQYKDVDGLRSKITELQDANKIQKEVYDKQLKDVTFNNALEKGIDTFNVKDKTLIMTLLNKENLKFNGETIEGLKEEMEFIKKERDYLFEKEINGTSSFSTGGTEFARREKKNFATELGKEKAAMNTRGIEAFTK